MTKNPKRKAPAAKRVARRRADGSALASNEVKGVSPEARDMTRKPGGLWARVRGLFNRP